MQDITQEAIAIIESSKLLSGSSQDLFKVNLNYFINNNCYAPDIIKKEVERIIKIKQY
jgi:hypothetical protein